MSDSLQHPVSVKISYWIPEQGKDNGGIDEPTETRILDASNVEVARIGLPEHVEAVKPQAGDFSYSGMHDDGPLPALQEGGVMSQLIACVQKAKETNDEYLTGVIEEEKSRVTSKSEHGQQHESKKAKTTA